MKKVKDFLSLNFWIFIMAFSVCLFISPFNIVGGGVSGLGILIEYITTKDFTIFVLLLNIVFALAGLIFLGKKYFINTIYGSLAYPLFLFLSNALIKLINIELIDPFACTIFGAILSGIGLGNVVKRRYNTGGVDILQQILFKYFNMPYSKSLFIIDGLIVTLGAIFINFQSALYGIVYVILSGFVLDNVIFGGYNKRAVYIISNKEEEIKKHVLEKIQRGLTNIYIEKEYTKEKQKMLLCVLSTNEYFELRRLIQEIDPTAFVFVTKATEVLGLGFSLEDDDKINNN